MDKKQEEVLDKVGYVLETYLRELDVDSLRLTGIWMHKDRRGEPYGSGDRKPIRFMLIPARNKRPGSPEYHLIVTHAVSRNNEREAAEGAARAADTIPQNVRRK